MADTISSEEIKKIKNTTMLLILGKDRSGTSLLRRVLNAHPAITSPPESKFIIFLYPRFIRLKYWSEKDVFCFIEELFSLPAFTRLWNMDKTLVANYLLAARETLDYALACKIVYYLWGGKSNVLYLCDKKPGYFLFTKELFNLFPELKFIHIVREPRDNVLSTFRAFGAKNAFYIANRWLAINIIIEKLKRKMPGRSITVLYEKMVENPEAVFKSICGFLNVPFFPEMLNRNVPENFYKDTPGPETLAKKRGKVFGPISTTSIGKWKTELKPFDVAVIERIAGSYAASQYGYDMESSPGKKNHVPYFKILKGKYIYYIRQEFTRMRYKSYRINKIYSRFQQKKKGEKILPIEYF